MIPGKNRWFMFLLLFALPCLFSCSSDSERNAVVLNFKVKTKLPRTTTGNDVLNCAVSAMVSPRETFEVYEDLLSYIGQRLGKKIVFKQRKTYREINELLEKGEIDLAFICSGAYLELQPTRTVELLASPQIGGERTYHSLLITQRDSPIQSMSDLKGKKFAFTDRLSLTGYRFPVCLLASLNAKPETFFSQTFFTYGHDRAINAVAHGIADGACVDSLVYSFLRKNNPRRIQNTRILMQSEAFGSPPVVVPRSLPKELKEKLQQIMLTLHQSVEGMRILQSLNIERFVKTDDTAYTRISHYFRSHCP